MKVQARSRREQIRTMLADLKLPGSLEAVDEVLRDADGGTLTAAEAIERLLGAQITLRNNRRLQTAMRASRRPSSLSVAPRVASKRCASNVASSARLA